MTAPEVRYRVRDAAAALEQLAPLSGAADWDNVGLLAGSDDWPAMRVHVALDVTDAVAQRALDDAADLIVAYHPPIFRGTKRVTDRAEGPTRLLPDLLRSGVSVYALHTALDAAVGGTNDALLDLVGTRSRCPLTVDTHEHEYKLVVFAPAEEVATLRTALSGVGAGVIGAYSECSYALDGRGSFLGDASTNPTLGTRQQLEYVDETRLEMVVPRARIGEAVRTLYEVHAYEEPAFDIYPLVGVGARGQAGLGRVGALDEALAGADIVRRLAEGVDLSVTQIVGDVDRTFQRVIAAAGSFGVDAFRDSEALVLTGELKHHEALQLLRRGVTALVLGHAQSEQPVLRRVAAALDEALPRCVVSVSEADAGPFQALRT